MKIDDMPKALDYTNMTLSQIESMINSPDTKPWELEQILDYINQIKDHVEMANEEYEDFVDSLGDDDPTEGLDESLRTFTNILREGGKRRHIPSELKDKFIHSVLIIPNPEDRQSEIDAIFKEIAEKNQEAYFKLHPELQKEQQENNEE